MFSLQLICEVCAGERKRWGGARERCEGARVLLQGLQPPVWSSPAAGGHRSHGDDTGAQLYQRRPLSVGGCRDSYQPVAELELESGFRPSGRELK